MLSDEELFVWSEEEYELNSLYSKFQDEPVIVLINGGFYGDTPWETVSSGDVRIQLPCTCCLAFIFHLLSLGFILALEGKAEASHGRGLREYKSLLQYSAGLFGALRQIGHKTKTKQQEK